VPATYSILARAIEHVVLPTCQRYGMGFIDLQPVRRPVAVWSLPQGQADRRSAFPRRGRRCANLRGSAAPDWLVHHARQRACDDFPFAFANDAA